MVLFMTNFLVTKSITLVSSLISQRKVFAGTVLVGLLFQFISFPGLMNVAKGDYILENRGNDHELYLVTVQGNSLVQSSNPISERAPWVAGEAKRLVLVTAYSSTVDQTDDSPFITASGTQVRDGIVATNFLKFGTKVKFPELYGDKIFVVEDRMKSNHKVDIWFPTREEALQFGAKVTEIVIYGS